MAQKLSKQELIEKLLGLKEKQTKLAEQMEMLTQEINELTQPFLPKTPKARPLIEMSLVARVLREYRGWVQCSELAEAVLVRQGQPQFVEVGDNYYKAVKGMLLRLEKRGLVERAGFHWLLVSR